MANRYKVGEVAQLANTTVRALHHYDRIGLLKPSGRSAKGYRLYSDEDLLRLQQIHIGRELGLSLEQIRAMLDDPRFDPRATLLEQRRALEQTIARAEGMLAAIDAALAALNEEETTMDNPKDLFGGFDPKKYEDEARARWGETAAYAESARRTANYTEDDWARMHAEQTAIMRAFASALASGVSATDADAVELAERYRLHIDQWFYPCSRQMHANLAVMYVDDERFRASFDAHGEGVAQFVAAAIRANLARA